MIGQVLKSISGFYDILNDNQIYRVRASGKLRKNATSPLVGDFVIFEPNGLITEIKERKNILQRPKVANVDQAVIVMSIVEPNYSSMLVTKFLATIEFQNIKPIIIFTKKDLANGITYLDEYLKQGYQTIEINALDVKQIEEIKNIFNEKLTVFTGQTGVGKSTIISKLSKQELLTQEISKALGRGKHTTRVVETIHLDNGSIIDTPGFSSLNIDLTKQELSKSFHDFRVAATKCKYKNCLHHKEENCQVKKLVTEDIISRDRYDNYLKLLEEAKNG